MGEKPSQRAIRSKMERFKKQQLLGFGQDADVEEEDDDSTAKPKFSFNLQKSVTSRELVNPQLDGMDKYDIMAALRRDTELGDRVNKIPKYLAYDIFSLFNNPMSDMKFGKVDENNNWQYNLLKKLNNIYLRTVTENSRMNSYITMNEYVKMLVKKVEEEQQKDQKDGKTPRDAENILKDWTDQDGKSKGKSQLDKSIDQANQKIEQKMKDAGDDDKGGLVAGEGDGSLKFDGIQAMLEAMKYLSKINISGKMISEFIKKSLKHSTGYFSDVYKEQEESIFDVDDIANLEGLENLHPVFRLANLMELTTHERHYNLNFDIYLDISGSMDRSYQVGGGASITGLDLVKITALKMTQLGFGKDIYTFNDRVHKVDGIKKVMDISSCGGTNTENVLKHIVTTGRPGVILTDMCDTIRTYTSNAYFIGILGASFNSLQGDAVMYKTRQQIIKYEGEKFSRA
jgi:hypothetical protein